MRLKILEPEIVIRWHRYGFRAYWRWKSRPRGGRSIASPEVRALIREMGIANPLWGAPRSHGELLKLGVDIGQTIVAKYMVKGRRPASQGWKTFLLNHADGIASIDMFVVPTVSFRLLYGLCPLDRTAIDRSLQVEGSTPISYSRRGFCLWRDLHSARCGDWSAPLGPDRLRSWIDRVSWAFEG
jgi:hypothetical protein